MARNFRELEARMSPESRARSDAQTKKMIAEMALDELREARELTQQHLANLLGINQAAVSKMERRSDMCISTLQSVIRAMGGRLKMAGWRSISSASSRKPSGRIEQSARPWTQVIAQRTGANLGHRATRPAMTTLGPTPDSILETA